mgnify:CR=1 FL=1
MAWTFITILTTAPEKTQEAFSKLEQLIKESKEGRLEGGTVKIKEAFKLFGEYDAILRLEIEEPARYYNVMDALANRICQIPGVQDTRTTSWFPSPLLERSMVQSPWNK